MIKVLVIGVLIIIIWYFYELYEAAKDPREGNY